MERLQWLVEPEVGSLDPTEVLLLIAQIPSARPAGLFALNTILATLHTQTTNRTAPGTDGEVGTNSPNVQSQAKRLKTEDGTSTHRK